MALFTPLTLVLAIFNPVTDCGCFGDAIHLTNWQSFFKNIVITLLVVFVFIRRDDSEGTLPVRPGLNATLAFSFLFLLFMRYNLAYLPVIDFRPYKVGTNLPEAMSVPPDAQADRYDIRFIYEKAGEQKEFTLNDIPLMTPRGNSLIRNPSSSPAVTFLQYMISRLSMSRALT